jgi:superfamily I DNA and RNA helicase
VQQDSMAEACLVADDESDGDCQRVNDIMGNDSSEKEIDGTKDDKEVMNDFLSLLKKINSSNLSSEIHSLCEFH